MQDSGTNWIGQILSRFLFELLADVPAAGNYFTHDLFIGEIVETYADESVLTDGKVDLAKLKPLLFDMSSVKYWSVGNVVAGCWNVGKQLKKKP